MAQVPTAPCSATKAHEPHSYISFIAGGEGPVPQLTCLCPGRRDDLRWVDLFGIDPDYCDGKPVDEWLDENRGEA